MDSTEVDDDDDLDFLEGGYMKDINKVMIKREASGTTAKRLQAGAAAATVVLNNHHIMEEAADDHHEKKNSTTAYNNIGGRKGPSSSSSTGTAGGGGGSSMKCCQAEKCTADLTDAKQYHRRHKVCEYHAKAQVVIVGGIRQRFCQQCSRFHELSEFDETKRSCRRRLAGHNERRRKSTAETTHAEGSAGGGTGGKGQTKEMVCGQVDDRGRIQITIQENSTNYKHFQQIR